MGGVRLSRIYVPAGIVCTSMVSAALLLAWNAGIDGAALAPAYVLSASAVALIALLVWIGHRVVRMALVREARPLESLKRELPSKVEKLLLPAMVAPLFLAAFTAAKTSMVRLIGFRWDEFFADMDALIFRIDPWVISHAILGQYATTFLAFFYTAIFGLSLAFVQAFVAIYGNRRFVGTFFLALLMTWFWGGIVGAYLLSSAGPVFAHLADPELQVRFAPLIESLDRILDQDSSIRLTQTYLATAVDSSVAVKGGGISAMPSMHVAAGMIYVMAARRTRWQWLAVPFLALTWIGSIHFGYHYAVDGLLALPIAIVCWRFAESVYNPQQQVPSFNFSPHDQGPLSERPR